MIEAAQREYAKDQIHPQILRNLEPGNEFLQDLVDRFTRTRSNPTTSRVFCFYETKSSDVGRVVGGESRIVCLPPHGKGLLTIATEISGE